MKTAISIPDDVFQDAERLARRLKKSRSELYSTALREFILRHAPDHITEAIDKVCEEIPKRKDPFASQAARRSLRRVEW